MTLREKSIIDRAYQKYDYRSNELLRISFYSLALAAALSWYKVAVFYILFWAIFGVSQVFYWVMRYFMHMIKDEKRPEQDRIYYARLMLDSD